MATTVRSHTRSVRDDPAYQAFLLLRIGFTVAPILFGLDKFTNLLTDWTSYLAPAIDHLVPGTAHQAMLAVGVVEIVAGLVVAVRPRFGGYLVAAWLAGIIVNLLLLGDYYDVALRDFGLLVAALALARLATAFQPTRDADAASPDDAAERAALSTGRRRSSACAVEEPPRKDPMCPLPPTPCPRSPHRSAAARRWRSSTAPRGRPGRAERAVTDLLRRARPGPGLRAAGRTRRGGWPAPTPSCSPRAPFDPHHLPQRRGLRRAGPRQGHPGPVAVRAPPAALRRGRPRRLPARRPDPRAVQAGPGGRAVRPATCRSRSGSPQQVADWLQDAPGAPGRRGRDRGRAPVHVAARRAGRRRPHRHLGPARPAARRPALARRSSSPSPAPPPEPPAHTGAS